MSADPLQFGPRNQSSNSLRWESWLKRAFDVVVSLLLLLLLSPAFLVLAVLVAVSSPGPVLFRQQRVGRGGVPFMLLKFRSMRLHAGGPEVTSAVDPRITPIGRLLRKLKLDELPQLFNVLKGEMSLVGPRPEVPRYVEHYTSEQREVLSVAPGITGLTQLRFRNEEELLRDRTDVERFYTEELLPLKLSMDLEYLRTRSFRRDARLLVETLGCVLPRRKAPVGDPAIRLSPAGEEHAWQPRC